MLFEEKLELEQRPKQLWAAHMCQIGYLDEVSEKAIETISAVLVSTTTLHDPPCCKK